MAFELFVLVFRPLDFCRSFVLCRSLASLDLCLSFALPSVPTSFGGACRLLLPLLELLLPLVMLVLMMELHVPQRGIESSGAAAKAAVAEATSAARLAASLSISIESSLRFHHGNFFTTFGLLRFHTTLSLMIRESRHCTEAKVNFAHLHTWVRR